MRIHAAVTSLGACWGGRGGCVSRTPNIASRMTSAAATRLRRIWRPPQQHAPLVEAERWVALASAAIAVGLRKEEHLVAQLLHDERRHVGGCWEGGREGEKERFSEQKFWIEAQQTRVLHAFNDSPTTNIARWNIAQLAG